MDKFEIAHQRLVEACDARSWRDDPENPDEPATIQAMQIALNLPKQEPPARTEVLEAAASAVVAVCLDERAGEDGAFAHALGRGTATASARSPAGPAIRPGAMCRACPA